MGAGFFFFPTFPWFCVLYWLFSYVELGVRLLIERPPRLEGCAVRAEEAIKQKTLLSAERGARVRSCEPLRRLGAGGWRLH